MSVRCSVLLKQRVPDDPEEAADKVQDKVGAWMGHTPTPTLLDPGTREGPGFTERF